ncbi:MAG: hypothetical protein JO275_15220 [Verrucomicrobia bacterium]|nr:hypothetical protein [Verrucomicrobiota bacterium]
MKTKKYQPQNRSRRRLCRGGCTQIYADMGIVQRCEADGVATVGRFLFTVSCLAGGAAKADERELVPTGGELTT